VGVNQLPPTQKNSARHFAGWMLCLAGVHDYRIISVTSSFGRGGAVEKRECRRCRKVNVRP